MTVRTGEGCWRNIGKNRDSVTGHFWRSVDVRVKRCEMLRHFLLISDKMKDFELGIFLYELLICAVKFLQECLRWVSYFFFVTF